jgi:hypothetical protein
MDLLTLALLLNINLNISPLGNAGALLNLNLN